MTILTADSSNLVTGALITEVVSPDGRYLAHFAEHIDSWVIEPNSCANALALYPHSPGMNALAALRRYLAEREGDTLGCCDACGELLHRDDDIVTVPVTIAGESNAATWQMCRDCAEGDPDAL